MAEYSSIIQKTNLPVYNTENTELSPDQKQRQFFGNYNTKVGSVDPAQYEVVRGYLLGKNINGAAVDNLAITLVEVATEQNIAIDELIDLLDTGGELNLNTVLCILLNTTRNRTSIVGFNQVTVNNDNVERLILA